MPVESCQVQLELESLRSGNRLFIPWPKDGSHIVADSMRSDGQSIEWQWSEDGAGFWIQIASIGKHEITFTLQPTARGGEKILSWRWPLPPHTTCRLNMSHELAERLDPISTWGTETEREPSGNLIIDLSEEAEVKLAVKKNSSTTESARVEQLQWARVWLGGSVIEARWKFTHAMSSTEAWQVECPRDCQLLMAAANVPAKATWHVRNGEPSLLEWLPAAPQRETELFALFFCPRDSATPWSFPTFVPQQAELTHSWGAINLSPSTRLKALTGVDVQWLDAQKFTSAWNTKESPQFVVDLQASTPAWTSLKGSADTKINSSTLRWEVYPNQVTWQLSAEIERNPTAFALGAVSVPTGSKIKSIQWISNGNAIPLTWLALPGGRISILSPEALTTSGTMHLVAQLPASDGAKRKVNIPHWESAEKHEMRVEWWRAPVVEVAIASPAAAVVETSTTPQQSNDLLPITAWKQTAPLHNEPTTLEWSSTPHRPEWEAIWTTTLQPWNDSWRCLFAGRVQLQNGTLPTLSFPWPTGWQPPRLLEGDAELTLKPSTTGQVLTISFDVPTIKHQRFVLETQLEAGFKWDRRLPRFRCNQAAEDTYLLRVPGDAAQRWETRGVNEIVNREHPHYQDGFQTYQAVLPDAEVRWQLPLASQQTPRVVFRETIPLSTQVGTSSRWQATWWIDPAGQTSCPLILSPHIKIEHVTIDGVTTVFSPTGLLNLRASDRPQCIRLVYALDAHGAEHPQPGTWSITQQADSNTPATTSILLRLEAVLSLIEQSLESQISDEASFVAWCRWWHTELAREVSELPLNLSQEHPELLDRATTLLKSLSQQSQQPPDLELVEEVNEPTAALDSISIETPLHRWQQGLFSVLIGVLWLGVVFGVAWLCQQPSILEAARRQSIFWHVLGGVAFMLLFSPYWLGAFFTLTAAARVLYWPWSQPAVGGIQSARRS
jgi:hypothetical protein